MSARILPMPLRIPARDPKVCRACSGTTWSHLGYCAACLRQLWAIERSVRATALHQFHATKDQ